MREGPYHFPFNCIGASLICSLKNAALSAEGTNRDTFGSQCVAVCQPCHFYYKLCNIYKALRPLLSSACNTLSERNHLPFIPSQERVVAFLPSLYPCKQSCSQQRPSPLDLKWKRSAPQKHCGQALGQGGVVQETWGRWKWRKRTAVGGGGEKTYWGRYWWLEDTEEGLVERKGWVGDGASTEIFLHKNPRTQTSLSPCFNARCLHLHCASCQQRGCVHGGAESWGATGEQIRGGLDRKPRDGRRNTGRGTSTWT